MASSTSTLNVQTQANVTTLEFVGGRIVGTGARLCTKSVLDWSRGTLLGTGTITNQGHGRLHTDQSKILSGWTLINENELHLEARSVLELSQGARIINNVGSEMLYWPYAAVYGADTTTVVNSGHMNVTGSSNTNVTINAKLQVSGTMSVSSALSIDRLELMDNGLIQDQGGISIRSEMVWTGGTVAGPASVETLNSLVISESHYKELNNCLLAQKGEATVNGTLTLKRAATFLNRGKLIISQLNVTFDGNSTLVNEGSMSITSTSAVSHDASSLVNHAQLETSGAEMSIAVDNRGTLNTTSGDVSFTKPLTCFSGAHVDVGSDSRMLFLDSVHHFQQGSSFMGSGAIHASGSGTDLVVDCSFNVNNVTLQDSFMTLGKDVVCHSFNVFGGTLRQSSTSSLSVSGSMDWSSGVLASDVLLESGLAISGSGTKIISSATLYVYKGAYWHSGSVTLANNASIHVKSNDGVTQVVLDLPNGANLLGDGSPDNQLLVSELGAIVFGPGVAKIYPSLIATHNSSKIMCQGGSTIELHGGSNLAGSLELPSGSTVLYSSSNHFAGSTSRVVGNGTIEFSHATWRTEGAVDIRNMTLTDSVAHLSGSDSVLLRAKHVWLRGSSGSTLMGAQNTMTIDDKLKWSRGKITGITVSSPLVSFEDSTDMSIEHGGILHLSHAMQWAGDGDIVLSDNSSLFIDEGSTFTFPGNRHIRSDSESTSVVNKGSVNVVAEAGVQPWSLNLTTLFAANRTAGPAAEISSLLNNTRTGTVSVSENAVLRLSSGSVVSNTMSFATGSALELNGPVLHNFMSTSVVNAASILLNATSIDLNGTVTADFVGTALYNGIARARDLEAREVWHLTGRLMSLGNTVNVSSEFRWHGGIIGGSDGQLVMQPQSNLVMMPVIRPPGELEALAAAAAALIQPETNYTASNITMGSGNTTANATTNATAVQQSFPQIPVFGIAKHWSDASLILNPTAKLWFLDGMEQATFTDMSIDNYGTILYESGSNDTWWLTGTVCIRNRPSAVVKIRSASRIGGSSSGITWTNEVGALVQFEHASSTEATFGGTIDNYATISLSAGAGPVNASGLIMRDGSDIALKSSTFTAKSLFHWYGGTIAGISSSTPSILRTEGTGGWHDGGVKRLVKAIFTSAGQITVDTSNDINFDDESRLFVDFGGYFDLSRCGTWQVSGLSTANDLVTVSGVFAFNSIGEMTFKGVKVTGGTVLIHRAKMRIPLSYRQTAGKTELRTSSAVLAVTNDIYIDGGSLGGVGAISVDGKMINRAVLSPGLDDQVSSLFISGNRVEIENTATLDIKISPDGQGGGSVDTLSCSASIFFIKGGIVLLRMAQGKTQDLWQINQEVQVISASGLFDGNFNALDPRELALPSCRTLSHAKQASSFAITLRGVPGTYVHSSGVCANCPPGLFSLTGGQSYCSLCERGEYSSAIGSSICSSCGNTQYQEKRGQSGCDSCVARSSTEISGASLKSHCLCLQTNWGPDGGPCTPCPAGSLCKGRGNLHPVALFGYWHAPGDYNYYFKCSPPEACPADGKCALGHDGRLCGTCTAGFYKMSDRCWACSDDTSIRLFLFVLVLVLLCVLLGRVAMKLKKTASAFSTTFSIALAYFQVVSLFAQIRVPWPESAIGVMSGLSVANFNFDITASECSMQIGYIGKWILSLLIPIVVLAGFLAVFYSVKWHSKWRAPRREMRAQVVVPGMPPSSSVASIDTASETQSMTRSRSKIASGADKAKAAIKRFWDYGVPSNTITKIMNAMINAYLQILSLAYLFISSKALQHFDCTYQNDGTRTLDSDGSLECFVAWWNGLVPIAAFFVAAYFVGIPLLFAYLLYRKRKKLNDPDTFSRYGMIYSKYRNRYYYFEVVMMFRKVLYVMAQTFASSSTVIQLVMCLLLFFVAMVLQLHMKPYQSARHNKLESILLACTVIVLFIGLLFESGLFGVDNVILQVALLVALIGSLVAIGYLGGMEVRARLAEVAKQANKTKRMTARGAKAATTASLSMSAFAAGTGTSIGETEEEQEEKRQRRERKLKHTVSFGSDRVVPIPARDSQDWLDADLHDSDLSSDSDEEEEKMDRMLELVRWLKSATPEQRSQMAMEVPELLGLMGTTPASPSEEDVFTPEVPDDPSPGRVSRVPVLPNIHDVPRVLDDDIDFDHESGFDEGSPSGQAAEPPPATTEREAEYLERIAQLEAMVASMPKPKRKPWERRPPPIPVPPTKPSGEPRLAWSQKTFRRAARRIKKFEKQIAASPYGQAVVRRPATTPHTRTKSAVTARPWMGTDGRPQEDKRHGTRAATLSSLPPLPPVPGRLRRQAET